MVHNPAQMQIGPYTLSVHNHGFFRLDGGAMFGSIPKNLWNLAAPADESNRILLATRSLILEGDGRKVMIDAGCGDRWNEKQRAIFALEDRAYVPVPDVTDVVLTHLHFDHASGITRIENGAPIPNYPNARHWVSAENLANAKTPHPRERASYLSEDLRVLEQVEMIATHDGQKVLPGISVHQVHGHTRGLQWIKVTDGTNTAVYPADLMPTSAHAPMMYVMGYDMCAQTCMAEKDAFIRQAVEECWTVVFEHDPAVAAGKLDFDERGKAYLSEACELPEAQSDGP